MSALSEIALQIASEIRKVNLREDQRIPTSDTFMKELMSLYSREPDDLRNILETLRAAKIIFVIKVVLPEEKTSKMNDPGVDAYAYADLKILNDLKYYSEKNWNVFTKRLTTKRNLLPQSQENSFRKFGN